MSGSYGNLRALYNQAITLALANQQAGGATLSGNNVFTGLNEFTQDLKIDAGIQLSNGLGNAGEILTSDGAGGTYWGTGGGGSVGTLADVLTNGNIANTDIDMSGNSLNNVGIVNSTGGVFVENLNGIGGLVDNALLLQATGGVQLEIKADISGNISIDNLTIDNGNITQTINTLPIKINGELFYIQLFRAT